MLLHWVIWMFEASEDYLPNMILWRYERKIERQYGWEGEQALELWREI